MNYRFNAEKINHAFVRWDRMWSEIFATQTDMSAEQIAERIIGDLLAYNHGIKNRHRDTDIATLAAALRVYREGVDVKHFTRL